MSTVSVNLRMDSDLKKQLEDFCSNVGLTLSAAFMIYAKKVVSEKRIPFEISINDPKHVPTNETMLAFKEAEDIIAHPELYKGYDDVDEMMKDILKNV